MPKVDLPTNDFTMINKYLRYQELYTKTNKSSSENNELASLQIELADYLITATDWNNIALTGIPYGATTGAANTYTVALSPAPTVYVDGMGISVKINVANTAASTINVNGLGAKSILKANGSAVTSGNLKVNSVYTLRYNGTNFILQGEGGEYGNAGASQVLSPYTIGTEGGLVPGTMVDLGAANIQSSFAADVTIPAGYRNGSGKVLIPLTTAGNIEVGADRTESSHTNTVYTKRSAFLINVPGTYRVTFNLRHSSGVNGFVVYGRIYKNDVGFGIERSATSNTYVTFTEDLTFALGDSVELWTKSAATIAVFNGDFHLSIGITFVTPTLT